jgi:hypothetical protein
MNDIIAILKRVTAIVKIAPFVATLFLLMSILSYFTSEGLATMFDTFFYVSPLMVGVLLLLSFFLKLCAWHRGQCLLLMLPMMIGVVDQYVYELSYVASKVNVITLAIIFIASIINAYHVFRRNGNKTNFDRHLQNVHSSTRK